MFGTSISMFDQEIQKLQQKKAAIESIADVASGAIDGISKTLEVLNEYPEEKEEFINEIASLIGSNFVSTAIAATNGVPNKDMGTVKKSSKAAATAITEDFSDMMRLAVNEMIASRTNNGDFELIISFDNKRSRNGTNSANSWAKEITRDFPRVRYDIIDNNETSPFDSKYKYLLKLWNLPELCISQLTRYNYRLTPDAAKREIEVVDNPVVESVEEIKNPISPEQKDMGETVDPHLVQNDIVQGASQQDTPQQDTQENLEIQEITSVSPEFDVNVPDNSANLDVSVTEEDEEFSVL